MKAIVMHETGDSSVLQLEEVPTPTPGPGEVLVKLIASGVNYIDIYRRKGIYPVSFPYTPGDEGMGIITELGEGVTTHTVGQKVTFTGGIGCFAEYTRVPAEGALVIPEGMDDLVAAGLPAQGLTAHYLAVSTFPLGPEHTALVHAGAGGVGQILIQLAKARGARVFTTVSDYSKKAIALEAGADEVLSYDDFEVKARELTGGVGVDVVYDGVGASTFDQSLASIKRRGMMVLYGAASGPVPSFDLQRLNSAGSLFITRPTVRDYLASNEETQWRWKELTDAVADGAVKIHIGGTYSLAEAAQAQDDLASRKTTGKLLLLH